MPDTQTEVYAAHPDHGWVEVATFGIHSPVALRKHGIGIPVMNLGLGVERMAMITTRQRMSASSVSRSSSLSGIQIPILQPGSRFLQNLPQPWEKSL